MRQFSYGQILVIGLGFFIISVAWSLYNGLMPLMLGEFIESKATRGAIMGMDNLANLFLLPIIGAWSDRINTSFGKRLPFLMIGMPLAAIFLFVLPNFLNLWTLIAFAMGFLLSMTLFRSPTVSLMPDVTPSNYRSQANGIINFMGGIGSLIAFLVLAKLYDVNKPLPFYIAGGLMLFVIIILVLVSKRIIPEQSRAVIQKDDMPLFEVFRGVKQILTNKNRTMLFLLLAIFFWFVGYSGVEAQFTTFGFETYNLSEGDATFLLGLFSLTFILFAIPSGFLAKKWGRTRTIQIGLLVLSLVFIAIFFAKSILMTQIFLLIGGMSWALINIHSYPMVVDMTTDAKIGLYTGIYYLFSSLSQMVGPSTIGLFMDLFGNRMMFIASVFFMLLALYFITRVHQLHKNGTMSQNKEDIATTA